MIETLSRMFFRASFAFLAAVIPAVFFGCRPSEPLSSAPEKLEILVAVDPIAYMVERAGGNLVSVVALTPQGKDPETYAPTPGSLKKIAASRGFLRVGLPIEKRFERNIKSIAPDARTFDLRENLTLLADPHRHEDSGSESHEDGDSDEESLDAHIWTSPANARVMAANIVSALSELDPANAETYAANAKAFDAELAALQEEIRARLEPFEGRSFVVFHPAYGYFAREFNLKQLAVEFEGKAPRPKELRKLIDQAKADDVRKLIVQPEFSRSSARAIAEAVDAELVEHSPLQKDYFVNMRSLTDAIVGSFEAQEQTEKENR